MLSETVEVTVTFDPNGETGPFNNTATVTGDSPATTPVTDDSDDGSDLTQMVTMIQLMMAKTIPQLPLLKTLFLV